MNTGKNELSFDNFNIVIDLYKKMGSINDVVKQTQLSQVKVRRILITSGLWESKKSKKVAKLLGKGYAPQDIARELNTSVDSVYAYMPYIKSIYGKDSKSEDANRADIYRKRKKTAFTGQDRKFSSIKALTKIVNDKDKKTFHQKRHMPNKKKEPKKMDLNKDDSMIQLHLELTDEWTTPQMRDTLRKYAKTSTGKLTRDIFVPADITLHALHYAIQRLFGWQNGHMHKFTLTDRDFQLMTGGNFKEWSDLSGVLFRFPADNFYDLYWDDDYDGKRSHKTWLARKYTGPYHYYGESERYDVIRKGVHAFCDRFSSIKVRSSFRFDKDIPPEEMDTDTKVIPLKEATIDEVSRSIYFDGSFEELMENRELIDTILPEQNEAPSMDDWKKHTTELVHKIENRDMSLNSNYTIPGILPFARELIYNYDFGDNWEVSIKCMGIIRKSEMEKHKTAGTLMLPSSENKVSWADVEKSIFEKHKPICISRQGMNLVDDVGGIEGFCNFLKNINTDSDSNSNIDPDDIEYYEWATSMGWSPRIPSPKTTL